MMLRIDVFFISWLRDAQGAKRSRATAGSGGMKRKRNLEQPDPPVP